jgi:hypothetical protein
MEMRKSENNFFPENRYNLKYKGPIVNFFFFK